MAPGDPRYREAPEVEHPDSLKGSATRREPGSQSQAAPGPLLSAVASLGAARRLLLTPRFGTLWFSSLLSSIGTWVQQVAEPWLLLSLGASSFVVGLDAFAATAPVWLLAAWGGALADRADRRRVIARFQSVQMLCPIAIVVLLGAGALQPWMVIALSVVVGVTDALSAPSFQSIVPTIVLPDEIPTGLALNATQFNLSRILGPSIAGVLMSTAGAAWCFVVSALSYVPYIGAALAVLPRATRSQPATPLLAAPWAGIARVVRDPRLRRPLLTVLTTSLFCAPLVIFFPVLVRDALHGNAAQFSIGIAAFGIGGLMGASVLLAIPPSVDRRRLSSMFAITYGAIGIAVASTPWSWTLPALVGLAGLAMTISNTSANAALQSTVDPHLVGQTASLYMLAMSSGGSIGALTTGWAAGAFGVREALVVNGVLAVVLHSVLAGWTTRQRTDAPGRTSARSSLAS